MPGRPQISLVARDRGGGYALATQKALPGATQVADRWHLMENASRAFVDAVEKSMRAIRAAIGAATIDPALLTAAERIQYEGYLRREETNAAILSKGGATIKEIVRSTGFSRGLVRKVLSGQRTDVFRIREGSLEAYLPWLDEQWSAGVHNGAELWQRLKQQGCRGCLRVVGEWAVEARDLIAAFQVMIRRRSPADLDPWLERAKSSLIASFAGGVVKDKAAVSAAIALPWSNPKVRSPS